MRNGNGLALSLIAMVSGLACGASEPFAIDPTGSGGLSGGNGSGGATAAAGPSAFNPGSSDPADCTAIPVFWQTPTVSLKATAFWIVADGKCYTSASAAVSVHSDPGDSRYTTLELTWTEDSREMRYFIYFAADGKGWRSNEMRTYNGQRPYSDWLYYHGTFFQSPIGEAFTGDIDLTNDPTDTLRGELHLHGVTLSTTLSGT